MFENRILNNIKDLKVKEEMQYKLYKGLNIYYSNNMRGIPKASHIENEHHFIINPNSYQLAFTDYKIETIEGIINKLYNQNDIQELKQLWFNNNEEFEEVLKEDSRQQNQYTYEDIKEYLVLLFNIEDELNEYNFKNEYSLKEALRIILMLSIKGYEIETDIINSNLYIKLKVNNMISGKIQIALNDYNCYKDIILINKSKKELLKNDLCITIYGEITNKIEGSIPFNIK